MNLRVSAGRASFASAFSSRLYKSIGVSDRIGTGLAECGRTRVAVRINI